VRTTGSMAQYSGYMRRWMYLLGIVIGLCVAASAYLMSSPMRLCGKFALADFAPGAVSNDQYIEATTYSAEQPLWPVVAAECKATVNGVEGQHFAVDWQLTTVLAVGVALVVVTVVALYRSAPARGSRG
jgi:Na+(H+)/acetate symporter ActP